MTLAQKISGGVLTIVGDGVGFVEPPFSKCHGLWVSSYSVDRGGETLSIDAAEVSLPIDAAIPCGLTVNELISNALKYAFPGGKRGGISLELASDPDNQVVLSVSNDGVGIPDELDLANTTTLGLLLGALLAEQLEGDGNTSVGPPALCCNLGSNRETD